MSSSLSFLVLMFVVGTGGFYAAYRYGRKTKRFVWREYIALTLVFALLLLFSVLAYGSRVIAFFFVSVVAGMALEYLVGLVYYKTLNQRLYRYERYALDGHTSFLVAPFWGMAGLFFFALAKAIGF